MLARISFIVIFLLNSVDFSSSSHMVAYRFHTENDVLLNKCIEDAMSELEKETCIRFERRHMNGIYFQQSGHCSWQESNSTVHLDPNCANKDTCHFIVTYILGIDESNNNSDLFRRINKKYNCTDYCTLGCDNGGKVNKECICECGYGFEGQRCETLAKSRLFTDQNCGVHTESRGTISLSSYPEPAIGGVFCQWLIKAPPGHRIEYTVNEMDIDTDSMPSSQLCNDVFLIWDSGKTENPTSCQEIIQTIGHVMESESNWLFIELRMNPWSEQERKGLYITYRHVEPYYQRVLNLYPAGKLMNSSNRNYHTFIELLIVVLLYLTSH